MPEGDINATVIKKEVFCLQIICYYRPWSFCPLVSFWFYLAILDLVRISIINGQLMCLLLLFIAYPAWKLIRLNGRLFDYFILCNSRYHRIDLFIDLLETQQDYYLFRDMNKTNLALSVDFRTDVARMGSMLESMVVGELAPHPHSFQYTDGRLGRSKRCF